MNKTTIVLFRHDLRLEDNPAFIEAAKQGTVVPLFILDETEENNPWAPGSASRWALYQCLASLTTCLENKIQFFHGDTHKIIHKAVDNSGAQAVYWNRRYWKPHRTHDEQLKIKLEKRNIEARDFNAALLFEPETVLKPDGTPYRVFTPFYKKGCLGNEAPSFPQPAPPSPHLYEKDLGGISLEALDILPTGKWTQRMEKYTEFGENAAHKLLDKFVESGLCGYAAGRDFPERPNVSRLSAHLHFGTISPRTVWHTVQQVGVAKRLESDAEKFCSELAWREFSYSLLYHEPYLPEKPLQKKFSDFPWKSDPKALKNWQRGQTGYPIVDAAMRELWETGYMHNRMRMITASFLVKDLLIHWMEGEKWFWDTLIDADLANNAASWQWGAGCGADAAPYFRIFNPVTQSRKFDPEGTYIRRHVPELAKLETKYIHAPWEAPDNILDKAGIVLGKTYPKPIIDHKMAREQALAAFHTLSKDSS